MDNIKEIETDIALIKRDITQFSVLFSKLDSAIDKIGEISNNISKLLAVHEERIEYLHDRDKFLEQKLEKKGNDIKELYSKIENSNKEIMNKLEKTETLLKNEFNDIIAKLEKESDSQEEHLEKIKERVNTLERWKWLVTGGAAVIGFAISKIPFFDLLFN